MKKSVLSIVAIAFAAVSVLSSCDKNDDGYGQSAKTQATVSTQSSQAETEEYKMEVTKKNFKINKDGNVVNVNDFVSKSTTMKVAKGMATDAFNAALAKNLYDYQSEVNKQAQDFNNPDVVIVVTLKDSKGAVVMQQEVKPGN